MTITSNLKEAVSALTELLTDTQHVSHPYTDAHVQEVRRRAIRIGAGLISQESRNRFNAVLEVGMAAVAGVQKRNSVEIVQDNDHIGVAGIMSDTPRWEDRLESLEYSLASFGLASTRNGDDSLVVNPKRVYANSHDVPTSVVALALPKRSHITLMGSDKRLALACCAGTYLHSAMASESPKLDRDDMMLFLDLVGENKACAELHESLIRDLGIVVAS